MRKVGLTVQLPTPAAWSHLAQQLLPVLPPQDDGDDGQQQQDDADQAANQDGRVAAVDLGDGEPRPRGVGRKVRTCTKESEDDGQLQGTN